MVNHSHLNRGRNKINSHYKMSKPRNFPYCSACRNGYEVGKEIHHSGDIHCRFHKHTNLPNEIETEPKDYSTAALGIAAVVIITLCGGILLFGVVAEKLAY
jgi:hypothetical protein